MVRLLRENQLAATFRKAIRQHPEAVVAVPFWGKGALQTLGLSRKMPVRVVCNLDHPGCNPDVIADLRALGLKVRTHPRLHAKIYATRVMAIVGSSNVSTNGLTEEGAAAKGWIEANVLVDNPAFVNEVLRLFEVIWEDPAARPVRASDIAEARRRRAARPPESFGLPLRATLLASCRETPRLFGSVHVAAYGEGLGENGARRLRAVKREALQRPGLAASDFRNAWGYQYEDVPGGAWIVDLDCTSGPPKMRGCFRSTDVRLPVEDETDLTIALRGTVDIGGRRFPLSRAEKARLEAVGGRLVAGWPDTLIPLVDVIRLMDQG